MSKKRRMLESPIQQVPQKDTLTPKLFWPTYLYGESNAGAYRRHIWEVDMTGFPGMEKRSISYHTVKDIKTGKEPVNIDSSDSEFWDSLYMGNTAYIVDKHFSCTEYERILSTLIHKGGISLKRLSILRANEYRNVNDRDKSRSGDERSIGTQINVFNLNRVKGTLYDIHDRFVLLDGEIWHFGCTVGGVNAPLTAYSRGWEDRNESFKAFLDKIIEQCGR